MMKKCARCGKEFSHKLSHCSACGFSSEVKKIEKKTFKEKLLQQKRNFIRRSKVWKKVVFEPRQFYSNLSSGKNTTESLWFESLSFAITVRVVIFFLFLLLRVLLIKEMDKIAFFLSPLAVLWGVFVAIGLAIIVIYVLAIIFHYFIKSRGKQKKFNDTFNVVAYSSALDLFSFPVFLMLWSMRRLSLELILIAIVCFVAIFVWRFYLRYLGFKIVHRLSSRNALISILIPYGIYLCVFLLFFSIRMYLGGAGF